MTITLTIHVHDEDELVAYARAQLAKHWPGTDLEDLVGEGESLAGRAAYEALIGSNDTMRPPVDYGIEILNSQVTP